jgi:hypothetical protein
VGENIALAFASFAGCLLVRVPPSCPQRSRLCERENARIAPGIDKLYPGTKPATMRRYGETDDKTEEVI